MEHRDQSPETRLTDLVDLVALVRYLEVGVPESIPICQVGTGHETSRLMVLKGRSLVVRLMDLELPGGQGQLPGKACQMNLMLQVWIGLEESQGRPPLAHSLVLLLTDRVGLEGQRAILVRVLREMTVDLVGTGQEISREKTCLVHNQVVHLMVQEDLMGQTQLLVAEHLRWAMYLD